MTKRTRENIIVIVFCSAIFFGILLIATYWDTWTSPVIELKEQDGILSFEYQGDLYHSDPDTPWTIPLTADNDMLGYLRDKDLRLYRHWGDFEKTYLISVDAFNNYQMYAMEGHVFPSFDAQETTALRVRALDPTLPAFSDEFDISSVVYFISTDKDDIQTMIDTYQHSYQAGGVIEEQSPEHLKNNAILSLSFEHYLYPNDIYEWRPPLLQASMYISRMDGNYYMGLAHGETDLDFVPIDKSFAQSLWDRLVWGEGSNFFPMP